jgi:hypothetical protein
VLASAGTGARLAVSTDGAHWSLLPSTAFPAWFDLRVLAGSPSGYVAGGRSTAGLLAPFPAAVLSSHARSWPAAAVPLPASAGGTDHGLAVGEILGASDGMLAEGTTVDTPGAALWWRSSDGRSWRTLPESAPIGSLTCAALGCGSFPQGLVAADGTRLVALTAPATTGWVSRDASNWRLLIMTGDLPGPGASASTLLPGGVLVHEGSATWFGQAIAG